MSALDDYDATAELKGRPTTTQRELAYAAAVTDRVLGAVTPAGADQGAFIRLAGAATREGTDFTSWVEARLCLCEDDQHALPKPGRADAVFYWTPDVAQVEAYQQFWSGAPHIRTRRLLLITIGGES